MKQTILGFILALTLVFMTSAYFPFEFLGGAGGLLINRVGNDITFNLPSTGTPGTYNRVTTDAHGRVTAGAVDSAYIIMRPLNSNFTVSSTRNAFVNYSIQIESAPAATFVFLETSPDAVIWTEICRRTALQNGPAEISTGPVLGGVPANYFVRLRTSGPGIVTVISGQEIQR